MSRVVLAGALALASLVASAKAQIAAEKIPVAIAAARIAQVSAPLLGRPYRVDPLGEGESGAIDDDPVWRSDAFDCLTFVETVIALARTADETQARPMLQLIRYSDGVVNFERRNHFPDADWIPNNLRAGMVRAVTLQVASALGRPDLLTHARGVVRRARWINALPHNPIQAGNARLHPPSPQALAELAAWATQSHDEPVDITYIRLRELSSNGLQAVIDQLPDGAVLFIVRPNTSLVGSVGAVTQISHAGFLLRDTQGVAQFRNASSGRARRVIDLPLLPYLLRMQRTRSFAGVLIFQVLAPP